MRSTTIDLRGEGAWASGVKFLWLLEGARRLAARKSYHATRVRTGAEHGQLSRHGESQRQRRVAVKQPSGQEIGTETVALDDGGSLAWGGAVAGRRC